MTKTLDCALRLLTRREHSTKELSDKLKQKGFPQEEISDVIESCQRLNLQSDQRFTEHYVRWRIRQGYGPLKISHELRVRGIGKKNVRVKSIYLFKIFKNNNVFYFTGDLIWISFPRL
jgi:regulatory protein